MMYGQRKSDSPIVPLKSPNKAARAAAEVIEGRGGAKGNAVWSSTCQTQSWESVSLALDRIRETARRDKRVRFTALLHHVTIDLLRCSFYQLKRRAAAGIDGVTWDQYEAGLEKRLADLHGRVHRGAYRAKPSRRQYIPKPDGRQRPLGIAALEDKIVQRAVVEILNAIYETDFLGFSYGFRPGRNQHDALDALATAIYRKKVNWILDADIRAFFDSVSWEWLVRFLEHRIADRRLMRLIGKWLKAGVLEDGRLLTVERGTPQGAMISPVLANIYLHYVYDLWVHQWRKQKADGEVVVVRYADDTVVGFQRRSDAERFLDELRQTIAEVRTGTASAEDPDHRIRALCGAQPQGTGARQAGNLRLPRLHAHLRNEHKRGLPDPAAHHSAAAAGKAPASQRDDRTVDAPAGRGAGALPEAGDERLLQLLCRSHQQPGDQLVLSACRMVLVPRATAAEPDQPADMAANETTDRLLAAIRTHPASAP
jgi:group II intron reverse transcriptase/maturase